MNAGTARLPQRSLLSRDQVFTSLGMADKSESEQERVGERIAKVIARAGLCSRRDAEAWIDHGRVAVNGTVIRVPGIRVRPEDRGTVDGVPLPARERTRLFLYHKPRGLVTTHHDPQGRPTVFATLPRHLPRLVSVGRLDFNTEGLLLLTNHGSLAGVLEAPSTAWLRRYRVRVHGSISQTELDGLRKGVTIDGIHYGKIDANLDRRQGANVWLTVGIREGRNHEVRNVMGHLGLQVTRLIRVSFGPFQLGELPPGGIEEVRTRHLREQIGERLAEVAEVDFAAPITLRAEPAPTGGPKVKPPGARAQAAQARAKGRGRDDRAERGPQKPRRKPRPYHGKRER